MFQIKVHLWQESNNNQNIKKTLSVTNNISVVATGIMHEAPYSHLPMHTGISNLYYYLLTFKSGLWFLSVTFVFLSVHILASPHIMDRNRSAFS